MKIYRNRPSSGHQSFTVVYNSNGVKRATRSKLSDARKEAERVALELAQTGSIATPLTDAQRHEYFRAVKALEHTGIPVDSAAEQLAAAMTRLKGESLSKAVEYFMSNYAGGTYDKIVQSVVDELVAFKAEKGRSAVYTHDLRVRLDKFSRSFRCNIASVTTAQLEEFLRCLSHKGRAASPRTKNNFLRMLGTLFSFAHARKYIPKDHPGVSEVEKATEPNLEVEIFTAEELRQLLRRARPEMIPYLAICAFAGVRDAELSRLDWSDIDASVEGYIEVKSCKAKTRVRRLIPISENLRAWLAPYRQKTGPVVPFVKMSSQLERLAVAANLSWKRNGLRHGFVSHSVALTDDVNRVANLSGNSVRIIQQHYLKRIPKIQGQRWFNIFPPTDQNVVRLSVCSSAA